MKRFCTTTKPNVRHVKCGNSNLQHDHQCMDQFVSRLKDSSTNLPDDQKLAASCCCFIHFENCILNRMEKESNCNKEDIKHFKGIVHSTAGEV